MKYDYLIVGSGLYGAVFAYMAHKSGLNVLVIDKRAHIGGNVYCETIESINIHKYGAHIFHTSNKEVWQFINQFAEFNHYVNSPIANYNGKLYNLPFNMNTFYAMWGVKTPLEAILKINEQKELYRITEPSNLEEQAISLVGKDIYETLIKGYTEKQWGRKCAELPAFIIKRIPLRFTFNNNYFNDIYQGIPIGGYNKIIDGLLNGVEVLTNTDFFIARKHWNDIASKIVFTGKIDEYYDYQFGHLEYRTLNFENELLNIQNYQGNAVVNYTSHNVPYTRIIEHKHFDIDNTDVFNLDKTIITKEYSAEWSESSEPFYPVNDNRNDSIYKQYKALAEKENRVIFGGRLAEYKYYDMDDVIEKAMQDAKNELK